MRLKIKYHQGLFFLLMISPLLPDKLGLFTIYAFILIFLFSKKVTSPLNILNKNQKWILRLSIAFFLMYALSVLWGGEFVTGIKSVEKKLLFLVLPSLFLIFGKRIQNVGNSVSIFVSFVNLALLTCLAIAIYQASIYIGFQTWPFKYYNFTYWIGIHPGYISLLVLLSLVCTGFIIKEAKGRGGIWWISLFFQSFMLFFIGAKYAIFSFLISVVIFLCLFKFHKRRILIGAAVFLMLFSLAFFVSVNSWDRIGKVKESLADRIELDKVGVNLVAEQWFLGYGAGNVDDKLKKKYKRLGYSEAFSKNYNIHNQYLQTLLSVGVIGFALLISVIVLIFKVADNRIFAFLLLLQFLIFFMIESVLVRQKGVVAFMTWILFISLYTYEEQLNLSKNAN